MRGLEQGRRSQLSHCSETAVENLENYRQMQNLLTSAALLIRVCR
jgi:hypothetical protein